MAQVDKGSALVQYYRRSNTMRVTEKGQVTIPQRVRRALGIRPGDEVEFVQEGDRAILKRIELPDRVA